ncbi:MAG: KH domain-containing protein [Acidobacteriota bacterium]
MAKPAASDVGRDLAQLIGLLIDEPEDLRLEEVVVTSDEREFVARVADDDLGKLIGRQGRTARSLRAFLDVRGELDGRGYALEIREQT